MEIKYLIINSFPNSDSNYLMKGKDHGRIRPHNQNISAIKRYNQIQNRMVYQRNDRYRGNPMQKRR